MVGAPMTADEDECIQTVELPVLYGASLHLYASGKVTLITTDGEDDLTSVAATLADLFQYAKDLLREQR
jgi:hypothetical protein